jgi:hypothetical protein
MPGGHRACHWTGRASCRSAGASSGSPLALESLPKSPRQLGKCLRANAQLWFLEGSLVFRRDAAARDVRSLRNNLAS